MILVSVCDNYTFKNIFVSFNKGKIGNNKIYS